MLGKELEDEVRFVLQDPTVERSLERLIRQERLAFAAQYDLPALRLKEPTVIPVDPGEWLYALPEDYQKHVFRARNGAGQPSAVFGHIYRTIAELERIDPHHTQTGERVRHLAVEDRHFAVQPLATDEIHLWYYRAPDVHDDEIREIPEEWVVPVLLPRVVLRAFRVYPELAGQHQSENAAALELWRVRARESLYGSAHTGETGFLNTLAKSRPYRVWGGRQALP